MADLGKKKHVQLKISVQWGTLEKWLSTQTSKFSNFNDLNVIWGVFLLTMRLFFKFAILVSHVYRFCFLEKSRFSSILMILLVLQFLELSSFQVLRAKSALKTSNTEYLTICNNHKIITNEENHDFCKKSKSINVRN